MSTPTVPTCVEARARHPPGGVLERHAGGGARRHLAVVDRRLRGAVGVEQRRHRGVERQRRAVERDPFQPEARRTARLQHERPAAEDQPALAGDADEMRQRRQRYSGNPVAAGRQEERPAGRRRPGERARKSLALVVGRAGDEVGIGGVEQPAAQRLGVGAARKEPAARQQARPQHTWCKCRPGHGAKQRTSGESAIYPRHFTEPGFDRKLFLCSTSATPAGRSGATIRHLLARLAQMS